MKPDKRLKLIREAAREEADGVKWRKRMERWMALPPEPHSWSYYRGIILDIDRNPLRFAT